MSEPNTSEPLHSSCTRQAMRRLSGRRAPRPRRRCRPSCRRSAAGRRCRSGRVTSSGNMPPVCSNRRAAQRLPRRRRSARRCRAGTRPDRSRSWSPRCRRVCMHDAAVRRQAMPPPMRGEDLRHVEPRLGDGDRRPDVDAARRSRSAKTSPTQVAPGVERDDLARARPIAGAGRSSAAGEVLVRSGRASGLSARAEIASAR